VSRLGARLAAGRSASGVSGMPIAPISRTAGRFRGSMSNWNPLQSLRQQIPHERRLIAFRADDLAHNDAHASSLVGSLALNVVGAGFAVQSQIDFKALGITKEEATLVQAQAERAFAIWSKEADAGGRMTFEDMSYQAFWCAVTLGEYLNLCRMFSDAEMAQRDRTFSFALRAISPHRLSTPAEYLVDPTVAEGVQLGEDGEPLGYWIENPEPFTGKLLQSASQLWYTYNPARQAHRPVVLHGFPVCGPEMVRGESVLAPAMKFFRDLNDCLDYNLIGQIVTAAFPMVVYTDDPTWAAQNPHHHAQGMERARSHLSEVPPGSVVYLENGERMQAITNNNPPNTFDAFVERILRAAGAAAGMPYEIISKDFSKTNYSSARAALLEAYRAFSRYQHWFKRKFLQPCWDAVFEEAWLRGMIVLPKGAPDFYEAKHDWINCRWIPPKRGYVDPLKEMAANIEGLEAGLLTYSEIIESNEGDWERSFEQQDRERQRRKELGLPLPSGNPTPPATTPTTLEKQLGEESEPQEEKAA